MIATVRGIAYIKRTVKRMQILKNYRFIFSIPAFFQNLYCSFPKLPAYGRMNCGVLLKHHRFYPVLKFFKMPLNRIYKNRLNLVDFQHRKPIYRTRNRTCQLKNAYYFIIFKKRCDKQITISQIYKSLV